MGFPFFSLAPTQKSNSVSLTNGHFESEPRCKQCRSKLKGTRTARCLCAAIHAFFLTKSSSSDWYRLEAKQQAPGCGTVVFRSFS